MNPIKRYNKIRKTQKYNIKRKLIIILRKYYQENNINIIKQVKDVKEKNTNKFLD